MPDSMIAACEARQGAICAVFLTSRTSFAKVESSTYCNLKLPTGDGILQIPESRISCEHCKSAIKRVRDGGPFPGA